MELDPHRRVNPPEETIVASIDPDISGDEYIIADISTDGAWIAMGAHDAPYLIDWR